MMITSHQRSVKCFCDNNVGTVLTRKTKKYLHRGYNPHAKLIMELLRNGTDNRRFYVNYYMRV